MFLKIVQKNLRPKFTLEASSAFCDPLESKTNKKNNIRHPNFGYRHSKSLLLRPYLEQGKDLKNQGEC